MTELNSEDTAKFKEMAELGFGAPHIAREFGKGEQWARRQAEQLDVELPRGRNLYPNYRARVEEMHPLDAVDYLLNILEFALPEPDEQEIRKFHLHGFTRQQARVMIAMLNSDDKIITRERALACVAVHSNRANDLPSLRLVDMLVTRLRRKLSELDWPVSIQTLKGIGYRLVWPEDFEIPA